MDNKTFDKWTGINDLKQQCLFELNKHSTSKQEEPEDASRFRLQESKIINCDIRTVDHWENVVPGGEVQELMVPSTSDGRVALNTPDCVLVNEYTQ